MRALVLAALAVAAGGCKTEACKPGTLLVSLSLSGAAATASSVSIEVSVAGVGTRSGTFALGGKTSGTVEIDFPSFPSGRSVTVAVKALAGGVVVGAGSQSLTPGAGCANVSIVVHAQASGGDMSVADMTSGTTGDGGPPADFAGCVPSTSCGGIACGKVSDGCGAMLDCGACQVTAIEPALLQSAAGAQVTLEGTFAGSVTVSFPGGVTAAATVLGPHRASVVVPAGTTAGTLSVTTGGSTIGALPFRASSFAPGLGAFNTRYEQTEYARPMTALSYGHSFFGTVVTSKYVYVIDGDDSGTLGSHTTERALINADGTLGPFVGDTTAVLNLERQSASTVVAGQDVYVIGGYNIKDGSYYNSIEHATIGADGTLSAFTLLTSKLVTPRRAHGAVIAGNSIYVVGGQDSSGTAIGSIERATINPDGTLGGFITLTTSALVTPRSDATVVVTRGWLYVIGGASTNSLGTVERAAVASDGSIGAFNLVTGVALVTPRAQQSGVVLGNTLYVVDGTATNGATLISIEQATIAADGTLSTFTTAPVATVYPGRSGSGLAVVGNWLYQIGGAGGTGNSDATLQRASIDGGGGLGSFTLDTTTQLGRTRGGFCSVVIGNTVHLIGGNDVNAETVKTVDMATVAPDGTLSPFTAESATLNLARRGQCCAVIGGYVHVIGGYNSLGDVAVGDVESAPINADNTIGTFSHGTLSITPGRYGASCFAAGNALFVAGGFVNGGPMAGYQNAVDVSIFDTVTGTLGKFNNTNTLVTPRSDHRNFVLHDTIYIIGGSGNTSPPIESATFTSESAISTFSNAGNALATADATFGGLVLGSNLYLVGGGTTMQSASFLSGSLGSFTTPSAMLAAACGPTVYAFGNRAYAIGCGGTTIESTLLP